MNTIVFITTLSFTDSNSAGYNRILNYAKALSSNSINVILFSYKDKFYNLLDLEPICSNVFKIKEERLSFSYFQAFLSLIRLRRILTNNRTAYVFYPTSKFFSDFIFFFIFKVIYSNKIFCEINELRHSYVQNRFVLKKPCFPIIVILRNAIDFFFYRMLEVSYSKYNGIITISSNLNTYIKKYNSKVLTIPILVDVPEKYEYCDLHFNENFNIGFFGTISFKKEGLSNLFQAIKSLLDKNYNFKLFLYGPISDIEKKVLQNLINEESILSSIIYKGIFSHHLIFTEMRKMNLLFLPRPLNTQTNFGFSTKLAEYLISGVPVLVTDVSDNKIYIKDGFNGYMFDEISATGFERKLIDIVGNYEVEKHIVSKEAFNTAKNHFDYRLYKDILTNFFFGND